MVCNVDVSCEGGQSKRHVIITDGSSKRRDGAAGTWCTCSRCRGSQKRAREMSRSDFKVLMEMGVKNVRRNGEDKLMRNIGAI